MAIILSPLASKIYLDTNIIIYFLEQPKALEIKLQILQKYLDSRTQPPISSQLAILEIMVGYFKKKPEIADFIYKELKNENIFNFIPMNENILLEAAKIRAKQNFSLPDSIHIASAIDHKADLFITNDKELKSDKIAIIQLSEL